MDTCTHPDHVDGISCEVHAVGCSSDCPCCCPPEVVTCARCDVTCIWGRETCDCSRLRPQVGSVGTDGHEKADSSRAPDCRALTTQGSLYDPSCGECVATQRTLFDAEPVSVDRPRIKDLPGQTFLA
jgi:hypothetical protein